MSKFINLIMVLAIFSLYAKSQVNKGLTFEAGYTGEFVYNFSGGIKQAEAYLGMWDISLGFNSDDAGLWQGTEIILHGLNMHGDTPSESLVGDAQAFSNIENGPATVLYEIYLKQTFGNAWLLIGQHDLNADFAWTEYAGLFQSSSFGILPTFSGTDPAPAIFPLAAPAILAGYSLNNFSIRAGIYDGNPGDFDNNKHNMTWRFTKEEGIMSVIETEYLNEESSFLSLKLGGYLHSTDYIDFTDSTNVNSSNSGIYASIDKELIPADDIYSNGLGAFVQLGLTPSDRNYGSFYFGAGINCHSIFPSQPDDLIGLAIAYLGVSNDYQKIDAASESSETAIELLYQVVFNENYSIQPNLQYIINPGATEGVDNALVGTIRMYLNL